LKKIVCAVAALLFSLAGSAQSVSPSDPYTYNWPAATAVGAVSGYLVLTTPPNVYTIDTYVTGTQPSICTFEVQSSPDGVVWNSGTGSLSGDISCASGANNDLTYSFVSKPIRYLRIKVGTLTGADGTTHVFFFYTRGRVAL
jgi:hypothetical protein